MRFNEVEENDRLEWLIRKDGCMHCSEPGCLKMSCTRRNYPICERYRGFPI